MQCLTIVYDQSARAATHAALWLARQPSYVALRTLALDSDAVGEAFPGLSRAWGRGGWIAVGDAGEVWGQPEAWVIALWALRRHRARALAIARDGRLDQARAFLVERALGVGAAAPQQGSPGGVS